MSQLVLAIVNKREKPPSLAIHSACLNSKRNCLCFFSHAGEGRRYGCRPQPLAQSICFVYQRNGRCSSGACTLYWQIPGSFFSAFAAIAARRFHPSLAVIAFGGLLYQHTVDARILYMLFFFPPALFNCSRRRFFVEADGPVHLASKEGATKYSKKIS